MKVVTIFHLKSHLIENQQVHTREKPCEHNMYGEPCQLSVLNFCYKYTDNRCDKSFH